MDPIIAYAKQNLSTKIDFSQFTFIEDIAKLAQFVSGRNIKVVFKDPKHQQAYEFALKTITK